MDDIIASFLESLDDYLAHRVANGERVKLYHIGKSAIVWKYKVETVTQDFDILTPQGTEDPLIESALLQFGRGTANAELLGLYLEGVNPALPPVAGGFEKRAIRMPGTWKAMEIWHLEPNDLAATKLKRFAAKDRFDIRFLADQGLLSTELLEARLQSAFWYTMEKDGDRDRDRAFENLKIVQNYLRGEIAGF